MRHLTLLRLTLANTVLVTLAFVAVPLPPDALPGGEPALLPQRTAGSAPFDEAVRALGAEFPAERTVAVRVLAALRDRRGAVHVAALRDDADPGVAREAALALAALTGDAGVVRTLAARAMEDHRTVRALAGCAGPAAEEELLALTAPRDPYVRGEALKALALRAPDLAAPRIAAALADGEPALRFLALEAAQVAPDPALVPELRVLRASPDRLERRLALAALVRVGEPGAEDELAGLVEEAHRLGDAWLALLAAEALAGGGSPRGAALWSRALDSMSDEERAMAVRRLRTRVAPLLDPELRRLLDAGGEDVRVAAALALGERGERGALPVLRATAGSRTSPDAAECSIVLAAFGAAN